MRLKLYYKCLLPSGLRWNQHWDAGNRSTQDQTEIWWRQASVLAFLSLILHVCFERISQGWTLTPPTVNFLCKIPGVELKQWYRSIARRIFCSIIAARGRLCSAAGGKSCGLGSGLSEGGYPESEVSQFWQDVPSRVLTANKCPH